MNESVLLELSNAIFAWLALFASVIFLRYMYKNFGLGYRFLQASIALTPIWIGQVIIRGPLWYSRYLVNDGRVSDVPNTYVIVGSALCIIGFLCVIRVFSDETWKPWAWKVALAGGIAFLIASYNKILPI
jgi:hypothetical protein